MFLFFTISSAPKQSIPLSLDILSMSNLHLLCTLPPSSFFELVFSFAIVMQEGSAGDSSLPSSEGAAAAPKE